MAAALLASAVFLGIYMQRPRSHSNVLKGESTPARYNPSRAQPASVGQEKDAQKSGAPSVRGAKVDAQPQKLVEAKRGPPQPSTPAATSASPNKPAAASSPEKPGPAPRLALDTPQSPREPREIASFKAPGPVKQSRLLLDNKHVVYETAGNALREAQCGIRQYSRSRRIRANLTSPLQLRGRPTLHSLPMAAPRSH